MASSSARVVYAALAGNLAIAGCKFGAFALSGSSAMLTEAIHSLVDSVDQVLLLIAQKRAAKPADRSHPLGHGMETYFWSFIVALFVFFAGGLAAFYEGVRHLLAPEPIVSPGVSLGVLFISAVFEGSSLAVAFREFKCLTRGRDVSLWTFIKASKDPSLYGTLLEDSAAIIGIVVAAVGVIASSYFKVGWADGAASITIGCILVGVSGVLANETRSLIAGEAVAPPIMEKLRNVLREDSRILHVDEIASLQLGPQSVLIALTLRLRPELTMAELSVATQSITEALQAVEKRVGYVYFRPENACRGSDEAVPEKG